MVAHRASVAAGGDPAQDKLNARHAALEAHGKETVAEIGNWYFDECGAGRHKPNAKAPKRASTLRTETLYFNKNIVPRFGKIKLEDLSRAMNQAFVNELADKQSKSAARHCRVVLHGIFAFAQRQDITEKANPCQHVTVAAHAPRERVLKDVELKTIWRALQLPVEIEGAPISASVACSIRLTMVTLQRRAEVAGMRLSELDLEKRLWTLPAKRNKNNRAHVVPLSPLALEIIDLALSVRTKENDFVFPSPRFDDRAIDPQAITSAFIRMKQALRLDDVRPHDLRKTGATNLTGEILGFSRFMVSKVLNHSSDTGNAAIVTSVYDRNEYLSEKRRALDAWAGRLLEIVEDVPMQSNVTNFERR